MLERVRIESAKVMKEYSFVVGVLSRRLVPVCVCVCVCKCRSTVLELSALASKPAWPGNCSSQPRLDGKANFESYLRGSRQFSWLWQLEHDNVVTLTPISVRHQVGVAESRVE